MSFKCGTVGVIGRANVGKSSFINAVIKEKVSIVSPKPQTTRNNIMGIYNDDDSQIVFVDTPGVYESKDKLGDFMNKSVTQASDDVDVLIVMFDGSRDFTQKDFELIKRNSDKKVLLLISKTDLVTFEQMYPKLSKLNDLNVIDIIPFSSVKRTNIDVILDKVKSLLPDSTLENCLFDREEYTDKSVKFISAEIIREKTLWYLSEEVPHGIGVHIAVWEEEDNFVRICADIICDKPSHKPIIIGSKGSGLKKIGSAARQDIERMLDKKINLELWVKVKEDWKNNTALLNQIGYNRYDIE